MIRKDDLLNCIEIRRPCPADWSAMQGDQKRRFCDSCNLYVHNLSAMGSEEARTLLESTEGRLCVRFERNSRGQVLTQTRRRHFNKLICALAGGLAAIFGISGCQTTKGEVTTAQGRVASISQDQTKPPEFRPTLGMIEPRPKGLVMGTPVPKKVRTTLGEVSAKKISPKHLKPKRTKKP